MSKFSESEVSEFRDTFCLFDKSGKDEILYSDVGECMRAFGFRPSNAEIAKLLNSPTKDEMLQKTLSFNEFLPILSQVWRLFLTEMRRIWPHHFNFLIYTFLNGNHVA